MLFVLEMVMNPELDAPLEDPDPSPVVPPPEADDDPLLTESPTSPLIAVINPAIGAVRVV
jgi:hypothetical protein